jgi:tetratricopeptide (TPR) repeat protein
LYLSGRYQDSFDVNDFSTSKSKFYYRNQARAYQAQGNNAMAAIAIEKSCTIDTTSDDFFYAAFYSAKSGDFAKALSFAQMETEKSETDYGKAEGLSQQARYLLRLSRFREASEAASRSISVGDKQLIGRAFTYRAEANYQLGLYKEAVQDATTAICRNQSDLRAYKIRAKCFEKLGRKDDAMSDRRTGDDASNGGDV